MNFKSIPRGCFNFTTCQHLSFYSTTRRKVARRSPTLSQSESAQSFGSLAQLQGVPVAQWKARRTSNPKAAGSIPARDVALVCLCIFLFFFCRGPQKWTQPVGFEPTLPEGN